MYYYNLTWLKRRPARRHCALGPYWAAKLGKVQLAAFQASSRGGALRVRIAGDRVFLAGQAVSLLRSELLLRRE